MKIDKDLASLKLLQSRVAKFRKQLEDSMAKDSKAGDDLHKFYTSATELHERVYDVLFDCGSGKASPRAHLAGLAKDFEDLRARHILYQGLSLPQASEESPVPQTTHAVTNPTRISGRGGTKSAAPPPRSDPTRITTGRHLRKLGSSQLQGLESWKEAEELFYYLTADTHGGKVPHGKRGGSYVSKSGKRIRKW
jgi:hypothetical protein